MTLYGNTVDSTNTAINLGGLTGLNFRTLGTIYTKLSALTTTTAYQFHWIQVKTTISANWLHCAELQFFEDPVVITTNAAGTATSTANTALTAPTTGDICMLVEEVDAVTATLNTAGNDLRCAISRNGGTGWDYVTLVNKGSWGTNKKILTANNVAFSNSASGTDMRYKIEWANQAAAVAGIAASSATGYETGDRTSTWTITTNAVLGGGTINNIIDGTTTIDANNNSFYFGNQSTSGLYIRFQLPAHKVYTDAKWYHSGSNTYGVWKYQGSNDGSAWTDIGSTFTLGGSTLTQHTTLNGNTTPYLYYQLLGVSGSTTTAGNNIEIEFNMAAHSASGGTPGRQVRVHATSLAWA